MFYSKFVNFQRYAIMMQNFTNLCFVTTVVTAKALSITIYQDDMYTEHGMKTVCRAAVAQWTKGLTRNGQTRVRISKGGYF